MSRSICDDRRSTPGAARRHAIGGVQRCRLRDQHHPSRSGDAPPAGYEDLLHDLLALWPSYLAYAVTFLFIGQVWANHHVMFDHIRTADRTFLLLNTLLL
jgi:Endosomal/lysosomal potassium channel TMEM175